MKAKEIASKLIEAAKRGEKELETTLMDVFQHFRDNFFELKETRKVSTDAGLVGIFRDQKSKWDAVNKRTNNFLGDYFFFIETLMNKEISEFAKREIGI